MCWSYALSKRSAPGAENVSTVSIIGLVGSSVLYYYDTFNGLYYDYGCTFGVHVEKVTILNFFSIGSGKPHKNEVVENIILSIFDKGNIEIGH